MESPFLIILEAPSLVYNYVSLTLEEMANYFGGSTGKVSLGKQEKLTKGEKAGTPVYWPTRP